jgi:NADH/NAD ratio-sensing transcriptional regulator Rex
MTFQSFDRQQRLLDRTFRELDRLAQIDALIQSDTVVATQEEIARKLGLSDRTIRADFHVFKAMGSPLWGKHVGDGCGIIVKILLPKKGHLAPCNFWTVFGSQLNHSYEP